MSSHPLFGRLITAMVSPFADDGSLDLDKAAQLANYLVTVQGNDALVINGTTGEAPTTTDAEKAALVRCVKDAVGAKAKVIAGVGTPSTEHSISLVADAVAAGADGLLVVTPYYSLPPQSALLAHFTAVASASELPCLLYDIPHRSGRPIETETLLKLSEHPNIVGVKDAKKDIAGSSKVIAETDLIYYAGDDAMTLPLLAVGGVGVVGTSTHFTGRRTKEMIAAFLAGNLGQAVAMHQALLPLYTGVFATQGCILVKSGLTHQGMSVGGLRSPMIAATAEEAAAFAALLDAADL